MFVKIYVIYYKLSPHDFPIVFFLKSHLVKLKIKLYRVATLPGNQKKPGILQFRIKDHLIRFHSEHVNKIVKCFQKESRLENKIV